jgi:hypothetical protein
VWPFRPYLEAIPAVFFGRDERLEIRAISPNLTAAKRANSNEVRVSKKQQSWPRLSLDIWRASLEAQQVIALRLAKLLSGGAPAAAEMNRMVSEKVDAALEAQHSAAKSMLTGNAAQIPSRTVAIYRRKMRANSRRLSAVKSPFPSRRPAQKRSFEMTATQRRRRR